MLCVSLGSGCCRQVAEEALVLCMVMFSGIHDHHEPKAFDFVVVNGALNVDLQ